MAVMTQVAISPEFAYKNNGQRESNPFSTLHVFA